MSKKSSDPPVELEKPGAGLPWWELFVARHWILPRGVRTTTWEKSIETIAREGERILEKTEKLSNAELEKRVLIKRIAGIEDSSRYWSAAMTLEHLIIVGARMQYILSELTRGRSPSVEVDVAKVKPEQKLSPMITRAEYQKFLGETVHALRSEMADPDSSTRLMHPWFGELTAREWLWVFGAHQAVHRRQIAAIIMGL